MNAVVWIRTLRRNSSNSGYRNDSGIKFHHIFRKFAKVHRSYTNSSTCIDFANLRKNDDKNI